MYAECYYPPQGTGTTTPLHFANPRGSIFLRVLQPRPMTTQNGTPLLALRANGKRVTLTATACMHVDFKPKYGAGKEITVRSHGKKPVVYGEQYSDKNGQRHLYYVRNGRRGHIYNTTKIRLLWQGHEGELI